MPDVKIRFAAELPVPTGDHKEEILDLLQALVAQQMSCWTPKEGHEGYVFYQLDRGEIDVPVFGVIEGRSSMLIIVEVSAYPYEDRMRTMKTRLEWIADRISIPFGIRPGQVSITFQPTGFDCWATGRDNEPA